MFERFMRLLKEKGKRFSDISKETGIPYSTFTDWKAGRYTPKADKLQKIADYFGVSVDYLMTGKDWEWEAATPAEIELFEKDAATPHPLTKREEELLEVFHKLSADQQEEVLRYGQFLYEKFHDERKKSSPSSKEA